MESNIFENVELGRDVIVYDPSIIGFPPRNKDSSELKTSIGDFGIIRPFTTIYAGVVIGNNFQCGQGASIREDNIMGNDVSVGTHAVLEFGNRIGNNVRIHTGCFLEDVKVGDNVFVGPNVTFTDDPHPMGCPHYRDCAGGAIVGNFVKIGANTTILPGVKIGDHALIGAGSVVTKDVSTKSVVVGNPAKEINTIDNLTCPPGYFERPYMWSPYYEDDEKGKS